MSYPNNNTLNGCITSLSSSVSLLGASLDSLDTINGDFGRLKLILDQNRIFTLIPEYDLNNAKKSLVYEIEPKILKFVEQIKIKLSKLDRKSSSLSSKIQLNSVRINNFRNESKKNSSADLNFSKGDYSDAEVSGTDEEMARLRQLKLKKDRLKYKLSSINLQNRKTRLSMVNR